MLDELGNKVIIDIDGKVSPAILAGIVDLNVSLLYQWAQLGRLPIELKDATYRECIQGIIKHYRHQVDVKLKKIELAREKQTKERTSEAASSYEYDGEMHPLTAAKIQQNIKTERAREYQIWERICIERGDYISKMQMVELLKPFITSIRDILLSVATDNPHLEEKIDEGMEHLYQLGITLIEEAKEDKEHFVRTMLHVPVNEDIEMDRVIEEEEDV